MMGFHTIPKGIRSKMNVMIWLEFELANHDGAVQLVSHDAPDDK